MPAIVRWPAKIKGGQTSDALLSQIDYMRSFANMIGARMPQGTAPDSEDCMSTLIGKDNNNRKYVLELAANHVLSVRTKQWKYIEPNNGPKMIQWGPKVETGNNPMPQLFDISASEWESNNLAEKNPQIVYTMQNILRDERAKTKKK